MLSSERGGERPWGLPSAIRPELSFTAKGSKAFAKWLENLPLLNIQESVQHINQALEEVMRLNSGTGERLELLQQIYPIAMYLSNQLTEQDLKEISSANASYQGKTYLSHSLLWRVSMAFQTIWIDTTVNLTNENRPHALMSGCYVLNCAFELLKRYALLYLEPPEIYWARSVELIKMAKDFNLADEPLTVNSVSSSTLSTAFFAIVLMDLSELASLSRREATLVGKEIINWANKIRWIAPVLDSWVIDLVTGSLPERVRSGMDYSTSTVAIDISELEAEIERIFNIWGTNTQRKVNGPAPATLKYLLDTWSRPKSRRFTRASIFEPVPIQVTVGASHISQWLALKEKEMFPDQIQSINYSLSDFKEKKLVDIVNDAIVMDTSRGGYRIKFNFYTDLLQLEPGEVVLVDLGVNLPPNLAEVRWLKREADGLTAGVNIISYAVQHHTMLAFDHLKSEEENIPLLAFLLTPFAGETVSEEQERLAILVPSRYATYLMQSMGTSPAQGWPLIKKLLFNHAHWSIFEAAGKHHLHWIKSLTTLERLGMTVGMKYLRQSMKR